MGRSNGHFRDNNGINMAGVLLDERDIAELQAVVRKVKGLRIQPPVRPSVSALLQSPMVGFVNVLSSFQYEGWNIAFIQSFNSETMKYADTSGFCFTQISEEATGEPSKSDLARATEFPPRTHSIGGVPVADVQAGVILEFSEGSGAYVDGQPIWIKTLTGSGVETDVHLHVAPYRPTPKLQSAVLLIYDATSGGSPWVHGGSVLLTSFAQETLYGLYLSLLVSTVSGVPLYYALPRYLTARDSIPTGEPPGHISTSGIPVEHLLFDAADGFRVSVSPEPALRENRIDLVAASELQAGIVSLEPQIFGNGVKSFVGEIRFTPSSVGAQFVQFYVGGHSVHIGDVDNLITPGLGNALGLDVAFVPHGVSEVKITGDISYAGPTEESDDENTARFSVVRGPRYYSGVDKVLRDAAGNVIAKFKGGLCVG